MQIAASKINPCLWFDTEAEEAAKFYCSVFKNSRMGRTAAMSTRDRRWRVGGSLRLAEGQIRSLLAGRSQDSLRDVDRSRQGEGEAVTKAFLQMKKFDIAALERAYAGKT
jgi:predicted 3-demethylubiquinone-9 3-methyltransferase (glyoxalase superfamily)